MGFALFLLFGLALADSTSIGTLIIPVWFLLAKKVAVPKFLLYLVTVAIFYFAVGLLGLAGLVPALQALGNIFTTRIFLYAEIVVGMLLVVLAFWLDPHRRPKTTKESRIKRWQRQIFEGNLTTKAVIGLAITATALELATMAPYIAAIAIIAADDISWYERIATLGGYVVVMVLPAFVLLGVRQALQNRVTTRLGRLNDWIIKNADDAFSWLVGIVGSAFACDGIVRLIIDLAS